MKAKLFFSLLLPVSLGWYLNTRLTLRATNQPATAVITIHYTADTSLFPNPERGFFYYSETPATPYDPLSLSALQTERQTNNTSLIEKRLKFSVTTMDVANHEGLHEARF